MRASRHDPEPSSRRLPDPPVSAPRARPTGLTATLWQAPGYAVEVDHAPRGPASLAARATLHFLEPPLAGLALRGFGVWRVASGLRVSVPRLKGDFDFLVASRFVAPDTSRQALETLEAAVLEAYLHTR